MSFTQSKMRFVFRNPFHWIAGGITGWVGIQNWGLALVCLLAFLTYEIAQDWRKKDWSYHDILEFVIMLFVVVTGLKIWEVIR